MQGFCNLYISDIRLSEMPSKSSYLNRLPVVEHLKRCGRIELHKPVTFVIGENGTGKSTLLEAVAVAAGFNAEGGSRNFNFATKETHSELYRCISLSKRDYPKDGFFLRAESFYNVATNIDELNYDGALLRSYGDISLHEQSHGESFLSLVLNRFRGDGLYILDEPESALSPMRLLSLIAVIHELVNRNSQFIISTHSPILMAYPDAEIYELSEKGITAVDYRETEHYRFSRQFLENPDSFLHHLLKET